MTANTALAGLDAKVREVMQRLGVPGLALGILRDGQVEEHGYGVTSLETEQPVTPATLFQIGSISKVYTATLVMRLVQAGKLDLDTPVVTYLPELRLADPEAQQQITLRHLLTHTSGLEGDRFDDYGMGDDALEKAIAEFSTLPQQTRPGELWTYCNAGFYLTGRVIERVLDTGYEAAMREWIFQPLGLEHSFFFAHEAIVYPAAVGHKEQEPGSATHEIVRAYPLPRCVNAAGGIISTTGDLLRFAAFHLNGGKMGDEQILSPELVAAMQQPQTEAGSFADHYGIGWSLRTVDGRKVVSHGGTTNGFNAELALVPEANFAVALVTNSSRGHTAMNEVLGWIWEQALGMHEREPERVVQRPEQLAALAGEYRQRHGRMTIGVADGGLQADLVMKSPLDGEETTLPPIRLEPLGGGRFIVAEGDAKGSRVEFVPAEGTPRWVRFGGRLSRRTEPEPVS